MQLLKHFKELTVNPKNAKELRGLILQLAVQGKLTANWRKENTNIEPASELLKKIQKEKECLIKEKKIRKEKTYPEIDKSNLTKNVPLIWDFNYIRDISSVVTCGMASTPKYTEKGRIFLSAKNVKSFIFKPEKHKFVSEETYQKIIKSSKPEIGDLLLTRVGAGIGEACVIDQNIDFAFYVSLTLIKPMKGIDSYYMLYWLSSKEGITKILDNIYGKGVSQGNLNVNQVRQFVMPIPPLEEQKEIVKVVETLFKEVDKLEQLTVSRISLKEDFVKSSLKELTNNNTKKEWDYLQEHFKSFFNETTNIKKLRETVLQLAVQGKLTADWRANNPSTEDATILLKRIQKEKAQLIEDKKIKKEKILPKITKEEIPYKLPKSWVWCRMGEIGLFERGKSKHRPRNDFRLFSDGIYPFVQTGDVSSAKKNGGIVNTHKSLYNDLGLSQSKMWNKGTLCITIAANIAETGILGFNACFPDSVVGFTNLVSGKTSRYVEFFITIMKSDLEKYAPSTAQKNINLGILYELKFPLPPLEEQKAIVEKVNALMSLCDKLEQEVQQSEAHSTELMKSCLKEVFVG
ncbi:restriction endonuclease subunit S [Tenacibaculum piscium]|uniref:restriction endonuclease subunit S n=1 Tax=Tenacibaculum piscium TaxID=1458515 RepID=UPI00187B5568|nr:restriction endonuclease subunit S [Tenacibaculum piscium]MBE7691190.1 restriction endonuclease subunit S [Tenacibaculum piscium]